MTDLSPAAQAVLNAFCREARPEPHHQCEAIAAALRAVADCLGYELLGVRVVDCSQLLIIADELENND